MRPDHPRRARPVVSVVSFLFATAFIASCVDQPTSIATHGRAHLECETEILCGDPSYPNYDSTLNYSIGVQGSLGRPGGNPAQEGAIAAHYTRLAGAGWVRMSIAWNEMQPNGPNSLDQGQLNRYGPTIKALNDSGVQVLLTLTGAPYWAQLCDAEGHRLAEPYGEQCPNPFSAAPDGAFMDWFRAYVALLADHFDGNHGDGRVDYFEIFNEPEAPENYIIPGSVNVMSKTASYRSAVLFAADALHPRGRKVVAGAAVVSVDFINALSDIRSLVDVVSVHHYGDGGWASGQVNWFIQNTWLAQTSTPVWMTETGDADKTTNDTRQARVLTREFNDMLYANQTGGRWVKTFNFALDILPDASGGYHDGTDNALTLIKHMYAPQQEIRLAYYCLQAIAWYRPSLPSYCYGTP